MDATTPSATTGAAATAADPRWSLIVARDAASDGRFWYSVATTGVYCRPSCSSRQARPENVTIHDSLAEARATGARPCLRCHPEGDDVRARMVADACRRIDAAEVEPTLAMLAGKAGLSPAHFQRVFKATVGLSPRAYAVAIRSERARASLQKGNSVTDAIQAAGYGSTSRFYEGAGSELGMAPSRYRRGGPGERLRYAVAPCSLGLVLAASTEQGLAVIQLGDDPDALVQELRGRFPSAELVPANEDYAAVLAQVAAFVDAPRRGLDLPLDIRGTAFQRRVWDALRRVPAGRTTSYAELARAMGEPSAARAVAGACAANPLAVAVPCHRVVRGDGGLSGYRWGVDRKRRLLAAEAETLFADAPSP